jgi:serine/threonine protein kinase
MEDPKETNADSDQIKALLAQALDRETAQARADFLQQACTGNEALRAELESLLGAHEDAGDFLETPPPELVSIVDKPHLSEGPGKVIDSYKLLELIGEGGMAVVYMAEQERPLRRRVALKIIKLGMDTKQVMARFDAERQALALMDHPNIARVFDAGATETGRPYFVMELVRGLSITKYCDQNKLNTQERLKLFAQVCNAVHHAHQKGIIHRDLKPSNIMVTMNDGVPLPKVIDFGIAKATNQRLTEHTVFTRYAEMIGTPEYMSPEQAEMSAMDIDTRTDIYSLGIVLYELLTGTMPFNPDTLRAAALGEIQRIIREEEPLRPSTRISSLGQAAEDIAARRCTDVSTLTKNLSKELEWIPLKAMRKDRTRRYGSASEFADDIQNYLNDRPLLAGPESPLYRLRKAVHKHRLPVVAGMAVVIALIIGLIISTTLYIRLNRSQDKVDELSSQIVYDSLAPTRKLYSEGRYQEAQKKIETKFNREDMVPSVSLLQAQLFMDLGNYPQAKAELVQLTQAEKEIAGTAHYLLARLYLTTDSAQVEKHRKQAEAMSPQTSEGHYLRGMSAASADEAVRWLSDALRLDSQHYHACKARALAFHSLKRFQEMAEDARVLVTLRPKDYLGHALRAIARRETGQLKEALEDHSQAIALCHIEDEWPRLYDQRRETHMRSGDYRAALADAQKYATFKPDALDSHFQIFKALLALGEYEKAQAEYKGIGILGIKAVGHFQGFIEGHVLDLLSSGQSLALPPDIASQSPFYLLQQSADFYALLQKKARPFVTSHGFWPDGDWSPDGKYMVYQRYGAFSWLPGTVAGVTPDFKTSFLEIMEMRSGKTRQISPFGSSPIWSPDGETIAFTSYNSETLDEFTVWTVPATGGQARKLAAGLALKWSQDSKHVYFKAFPARTVQSVAVHLPEAEPVLVLDHKFSPYGDDGIISPNNDLIVKESSTAIRVLTFPGGEEVARWELPWPLTGWVTQLQWHPNGKTLILNSRYYDNQMGMCLFDVEREEATHVFNLTRPWCRSLWSPDGSQLIISPFAAEPWTLDIDTERPLDESLASALTTGAFLTLLQERWDQRIAMAPADAEHYLSRAVVAMAATDFEQARHDLAQCVSLINVLNEPASQALTHWAQRHWRPGSAESDIWQQYHAQLAEKFPGQFQNRKQE